MTEEEIISICKKEVADAIVKYSLINVCQEDINDLIYYSFEDSLKYYKEKGAINEKIIRIIVKRLLGIRKLDKKFQMDLNRERYDQMIDEAYSYYDSRFMAGYYIYILNYKWLTKEEFIKEIQANKALSEECRLKIEERELSREERYNLMPSITGHSQGNIDMRKKINNFQGNIPGVSYHEEWLDSFGIPTKLITVTYNNETIESYE